MYGCSTYVPREPEYPSAMAVDAKSPEVTQTILARTRPRSFMGHILMAGPLRRRAEWREPEMPGGVVDRLRNMVHSGKAHRATRAPTSSGRGKRIIGHLAQIQATEALPTLLDR